MHDRLREADALAIALGELANLAIANVEQSAAIERTLDRVFARATRNVLQPGHEVDVARRRHLRIERGRLGQVTDRSPRIRGITEDIVPRDPSLAVRRRNESRQHAHRRRLPGAVRPEKAHDLARLNLEVEPAHGLEIAVALRQSLDFNRRRLAPASVLTSVRQWIRPPRIDRQCFAGPSYSATFVPITTEISARVLARQRSPSRSERDRPRLRGDST